MCDFQSRLIQLSRQCRDSVFHQAVCRPGQLLSQKPSGKLSCCRDSALGSVSPRQPTPNARNQSRSVTLLYQTEVIHWIPQLRQFHRNQKRLKNEMAVTMLEIDYPSNILLRIIL